MNHTMKKISLLGLLAVVPTTSGCATIAGTAVSPVTGGVDFCVQALNPRQWYYAPFLFVAGAVGGPFVALYNGLQYDSEVFTVSLKEYWGDFDQNFRPWEQVL